MFFSKIVCNRAQENMRFFLSRILGGMFLCLVILLIARLLLVFSFVKDQYFQLSLREQFNFWILSLRFDLKVVAIAYALPLLIAFATFINKSFVFFKGFIKYYNTLIVYVALIFSIVNYFYFKTYDKSIDTFIFAISKEDPLAVIKTVINDYPVGIGAVGLLLFFFIYKYSAAIIFNKLEDKVYVPDSRKKTVIGMIVLILVFFGLIRGSFGTFPLRQLNAQVTDKPGINYCLPNGPLAFYWAYKWEKISMKVPTVKPSEILKTYEELGIQIEGDTVSELFKPLAKRTDKNEFLEQNRPDIVFNVMESMSTHMMTFDNEKDRDLMGELRKHFKSDFVFKNFVSEGDGTSDSLTRMLVASPDLNLSTSVYSGKDYICNIAKLFNEAGYETIFVTASTASWRNYDNFLRQLKFSRVIERTQVLKDFPNATSGAWGIDDEYLFKETYKILKEKHDKPRFIMTLSITNHPPFRLPSDVEVQQVKLPEDILARFPYEDTETIFATFRYANDQLGRFIDQIKTDDELKNSTFVAATGDHNMRGIGYSDHPTELVFGHEVPFYLYMPQQYIDNTSVKFDKERLGSQKDIITTIVSHALSDKEFHSFGCDLLSDDKCNFPFAFNGIVAVSYDKTHACDISNVSKPVSYDFTQMENLLVDSKPSNRNCIKEAAMKKLESQLYYLQANKSDKDDFDKLKIN